MGNEQWVLAIKVKTQFTFVHLELSLRMATEIAREVEVESQEEAARTTKLDMLLVSFRSILLTRRSYPPQIADGFPVSLAK